MTSGLASWHLGIASVAFPDRDGGSDNDGVEKLPNRIILPNLPCIDKLKSAAIHARPLLCRLVLAKWNDYRLRFGIFTAHMLPQRLYWFFAVPTLSAFF